jgi:hypothetical protein
LQGGEVPALEQTLQGGEVPALEQTLQGGEVPALEKTLQGEAAQLSTLMGKFELCSTLLSMKRQEIHAETGTFGT